MMTISPRTRLHGKTMLFSLLTVALLPAIAAGNDLASLSDEFDSSNTLANWMRVEQIEQWNSDQLESVDINTTEAGRLVMIPYTVVWFQDYRGPLLFKEITGDFVITTDVRSTSRDGVSVPDAQYSLGGLMIRTPRAITPGTWSPGGENYVFFSLGHGNNGGTAFQFEDKTTEDSVSILQLTPAPSSTALLQIARLGEYVMLLRQSPGGNWIVHRRFHRSDLPATLQVGFVTYTNWEKCQIFSPFVHNSNVLNPPLPPEVTDPNPFIPFNPDLISRFEFARFFRPTLPPGLVGVDLTNSVLAPDAALLSFLGDNANVIGVPAISEWGLAIIAVTMITLVMWRKRSCPATTPQTSPAPSPKTT